MSIPVLPHHDVCSHFYTSLNSHQTRFCDACSTVLEDLSIRSNLALAQKKIINEMNNDENTDDFEREYTMLSAQVVSLIKKTPATSSFYQMATYLLGMLS